MRVHEFAKEISNTTEFWAIETTANSSMIFWVQWKNYADKKSCRTKEKKIRIRKSYRKNEQGNAILEKRGGRNQ